MVDSRGKRPKKASPKKNAPQKTSPKKASAQKASPRQRGSSTATSDLEAKLRERERQLRELTEQSLHFLDLLQDARQKTEGLASLEHRIGKLEEVLADARQRVRASRSILIPGGRSKSGTALDIVVWPTQSGSPDGEAIGELADQIPTASVTYVCPQADVPAGKRHKRTSNLQILAADCHTAAQFWNTAMAGTEAPLVLFLAAGAQIPDGAIEPLKALEAESVAMGQPVITLGEGERTLGLRETGLFEFERAPVTEDDRNLVELDFLAPEAFVIRRDAFHLLGPFDQDLVGYLALADYCLRAHDRSLRLVGLSEISVTVPYDLVAADERTDRDRLVLLAQHQPGRVADGLAGMDLFWTLPREELRVFLRALFIRLPAVAQSPDALEILVQEALSLGRSSVPGPMVENYLQGIQEVAESSLELGSADTSQPPDLQNQDPVEAIRQRLGRLRATFEKLRAQVETEKTAHKNLLDRLTAQVEAERVAKKELMDLLQTERVTVDSLQAELDSVRANRDELTSKLEKERLAHDDVSSELEARQALVARLTGEVEAEREAQVLARESQHLLDEGVKLIANALDHPDQSDPAVLAETAESLRNELAEAQRGLAEVRDSLSERNHWVTLLLQEIARKRLSPFPRKLTEGERQFLRSQGQDGST